MGLPVLNSVEAVLKQANVKRFESYTEKRRSRQEKEKPVEISTQGPEQDARKE